MTNFKSIHIGQLIALKVEEENIPIQRVMSFLQLKDEDELNSIYNSKDIPTNVLLKCCKLLNYDFFRIYSHHLILYKPLETSKKQTGNTAATQLPVFKKQLYTKEIIDFIIELIKTKKKTKAEIIQEYQIPKTTLYRWLTKYA